MSSVAEKLEQAAGDDVTTVATAGFSAKVRGEDVRLMRGTMLGRYLVLDRLGSGGMSVVYGAYDPELDRRIALKLLRREPERSRSSAGSERLVREAQAMAKLSHPNVAPVYDVGMYEDQVFVAMEYIRGVTLGDWVARVGRRWRVVLDTFVRAGRGLVAAHAAGVVHRDFKPSNVLVGDDGRVRVVDFGLAVVDTESQILETHLSPVVDPSETVTDRPRLTKSGSILGTPAYMAPEQHLGEPIDARTDQFSFCAALYEGLFGVRPFAGEGRETIKANTCAGRLTPAPDTRVPQRIRRAILRGLSVDPELRWPSMQVLLDELTRTRSLGGARFVALVGLVAGIAGTSYGLFGTAATGSEICAGAEAKLAGVWDSPRREAVGRALVASAIPHATITRDRVEEALDRYTAGWVSEHVDACEATNVRREQSERMLDERMTCLARRLVDTRELVTVLTEADSEIAAHSVEAVRNLPPVSDCRLGRVQDDPGPATIAETDALRERLAVANALARAGKFADSLEISDAAVAQAEALGYLPVIAEARFNQGATRADLGDYEGAAAALERSFMAGVQGSSDAVAAKAAIKLTTVVGAFLTKPDVGLAWADHARALLGKIGANDRQRAKLEQAVGMTLGRQARYDEAFGMLTHALAVYERDPTVADAHRVGTLLNGLGNVRFWQGRYDEALVYYRRATGVIQATLGVAHPFVMTTLNNVGVIYEKTDQLEEALAQHQRTLQMIERTLSHDHPKMAMSLTNVGAALVRLERYDEALSYYHRADVIYRGRLGAHHPNVANMAHNIGGALLEQGEYEQARPYLERAVEMRSQTLGADHPAVARSLMAMGRLVAAQGRPAEALSYNERALGIRIDRLGFHHRAVAGSLEEMATLQDRAGRHTLALRYLQRARLIRERLAS